MPDNARIHYAYLNAGGKLPNIVPAKAQLLYAIRSPQSREAAELRKRVDRIAAGAALMTDTKVDIQTRCIYDSLLPNPSLDRLLSKIYENLLSCYIHTRRGFLCCTGRKSSWKPRLRHALMHTSRPFSYTENRDFH